MLFFKPGFCSTTRSLFAKSANAVSRTVTSLSRLETLFSNLRTLSSSWLPGAKLDPFGPGFQRHFNISWIIPTISSRVTCNDQPAYFRQIYRVALAPPQSPLIAHIRHSGTDEAALIAFNMFSIKDNWRLTAKKRQKVGTSLVGSSAQFKEMSSVWLGQATF